MTGKIIPKDFYTNPNVEQVAQQLLGKVLCTNRNGVLTAGRIVETEAYAGENDMACHACRFGRTARTEVMFREGGVAYMYLCYGIHHMVNIVTNREGRADAVLVRALEPMEGVDEMMRRRNKSAVDRLTSGPGTVGEALGLVTGDTGISLLGPDVWLEEAAPVSSHDVVASRRIGVGYAGADALKDWRFYIRGNSFVSKK